MGQPQATIAEASYMLLKLFEMRMVVRKVSASDARISTASNARVEKCSTFGVQVPSATIIPLYQHAPFILSQLGRMNVPLLCQSKRMPDRNVSYLFCSTSLATDLLLIVPYLTSTDHLVLRSTAHMFGEQYDVKHSSRTLWIVLCPKQMSATSGLSLYAEETWRAGTTPLGLTRHMCLKLRGSQHCVVDVQQKVTAELCQAALGLPTMPGTEYWALVKSKQWRVWTESVADKDEHPWPRIACGYCRSIYFTHWQGRSCFAKEACRTARKIQLRLFPTPRQESDDEEGASDDSQPAPWHRRPTSSPQPYATSITFLCEHWLCRTCLLRLEAPPDTLHAPFDTESIIAQPCLGKLPIGVPPPPRPALRPWPQIGDYYQTCSARLSQRAEAYASPPTTVKRRLICTIDPETYLGPVITAVETEDIVSILVAGWWIDIWKRTPIQPRANKGADRQTFDDTSSSIAVQFAGRIPKSIIASWLRHGWYHQSPEGPHCPW